MKPTQAYETSPRARASKYTLDHRQQISVLTAGHGPFLTHLRLPPAASGLRYDWITFEGLLTLHNFAEQQQPLYAARMLRSAAGEHIDT